MKHNRLTPWLVALVVFGPFGIAMLLYYTPWGRAWLPQLPGQRELLASPVALPDEWRGDAAAEGRWLLIYARMGTCEQRCAEAVDRLSRVRQALNRDQDRVARALWLTGSDAGLPADPELADAQALLAEAEVQLTVGRYQVLRARALLGRTIAERL